ncbi:MAG: DUF4381 domain-containing protein [Paracoccaceae bacterium]
MSEDLSTLNLVELYDRLIPPTAPAEVSMMPQTVGWVWLAVIAVILCVLGLRWGVMRHKANAYRRAGLRALDECGNDPTMIATLLRRTALGAFPRATVAGLTGEDWLSFLDKSLGQPLFVGTEAGRVLTKAPYAGGSPIEGLQTAARIWIKKHKPGGAVF